MAKKTKLISRLRELQVHLTFEYEKYIKRDWPFHKKANRVRAWPDRVGLGCPMIKILKARRHLYFRKSEVFKKDWHAITEFLNARSEEQT